MKLTTLLCALGCLLCLLPGPAGAGDPQLLAGFRSYPAGDYPRSAVLSDYDEDGHTDLIVMGAPMTLHRGLGDGSLAAAEDPGIGYGGAMGAAADLDNDGHVDLVLLAGATSAAFRVARGHGDGSFDAPVGWGTWSSGASTAALAITDVNRDGRLDVVLKGNVGTNHCRLAFALGTGGGSFGPVTEIGLLSFNSQMAVGDLNADQAPDIVTYGVGPNIYSRLGQGNGSFSTPVATASTASSPACMAVGDVNGDGRDDVVMGTGYFDGQGVAVHLANADGTLGPRHVYRGPTTPTAVALGDVNRDGRVDVALGNGRSGTLSILPGNGDGTFGAASELVTGGNPSPGGTDYDPMFVAVADLDGNPARDLVAVHPLSDAVSVHTGNGDGTFGFGTSFATHTEPWGIAAADFDGDGRIDLAVGSSSKRLTLHMGVSNGTFGPPVALTVDEAPWQLDARDLNADGIADLVTLNSDSTLSVRLGGVTGLGPAMATPFPGACRTMALGDLNGDGRPDLVVGTQSPTFVSVMLGLGNGGFGARTDIAARPYPNAIAIGDVNHDGRADLVVGNDGDAMISVLLGNGDGTFQPRVDFAGAQVGNALALGDLNEDGHLDLVRGSNVLPTSYVHVHAGHGDGTFGPSTAFQTAMSSGGLAIVDLDRDGHLDVLRASIGANVVSFLRGRGDGSLEVRNDYGTTLRTSSFVVVDLDRDGAPDVATTDYLSNRISILRNVASVLDAPLPAPARSGRIALGASYPNPARAEMTIPFDVAIAGSGSLRVYDVAGRTVAVLVNGAMTAGRHVVKWDGRTAVGVAAAPGMYFYELAQGGERVTKRLVILN
ncbi:MAG TPA: FG-GAP-like repeat-containing protein [Candidatus Eisenbacteria bacterium]|nr:FG-GAP-like repeat-containing protein [Candidatus Eisenbacteria bacterium]